MVYVRSGLWLIALTFLILRSVAVQAEVETGTGSGLFGGSSLGNPNISLLMDTSLFQSNLKSEELEGRGIPGLTTAGIEEINGFNLRAGELFIFAPNRDRDCPVLSLGCP